MKRRSCAHAHAGTPTHMRRYTNAQIHTEIHRNTHTKTLTHKHTHTQIHAPTKKKTKYRRKIDSFQNIFRKGKKDKKRYGMGKVIQKKDLTQKRYLKIAVKKN